MGRNVGGWVGGYMGEWVVGGGGGARLKEGMLLQVSRLKYWKRTWPRGPSGLAPNSSPLCEFPDKFLLFCVRSCFGGLHCCRRRRHGALRRREGAGRHRPRLLHVQARPLAPAAAEDSGGAGRSLASADVRRRAACREDGGPPADGGGGSASSEAGGGGGCSSSSGMRLVGGGSPDVRRGCG